MASQGRTTLKGYFNTGDRPTEAQFSDLIDSAVNKAEDLATLAEIQAGADNTKFVTPAGAKAAVAQFAPVKTVNSKAPNSAGNVALVIADLPNLQSTLDAKLNTATLKTINGQSALGGGNLLVGPQTMSIPLANFALGTGATNNVFNSATDRVNLLANRTYRFKGRYLVTNGAARTSISMGFTISGALGISSIAYVATSFTATAANSMVNALGLVQISQIAPTQISGAVTAGSFTTIDFDGIIRTTTAGGLFPVIGFNPATGTVSTMRVGSYIEFKDIGSSTLVSVGSID